MSALPKYIARQRSKRPCAKADARGLQKEKRGVMKIYTIPAGMLRANSYLLTEDGRSAVLIDCGGEEPLGFARRKGLKIEYVLLTHGHFDHIAGCAAAQGEGAKIGCLKEESDLVNSSGNLAGAMGINIPPFRIDFTFSDGESFDLCGMRFSVIATPGHTPGGACFLCGDELFTGDTLFSESVGRTDFPGGSGEQLRESIRKLFALSGDKRVYPGHDEQTTLEHERKYNPFA